MSKSIFLVGFMGSGKTTWGKKLAKAMDRPFVDLDEVLVERLGMTIPSYFSQNGENSFREIESQVLKEQLHQGAVVSTGGGTPCFFDNMDWILENGISVYLEHTPKSLWSRLNVSDVNKRPALKGMTGEDLLKFISEKLAERAPFYDKAHLKVDQINTSIPQLISQLQRTK